MQICGLGPNHGLVEVVSSLSELNEVSPNSHFSVREIGHPSVFFFLLLTHRCSSSSSSSSLVFLLVLLLLV